jgi:hypothetical protein
MYVIKRIRRLNGDIEYACVNGWTRSILRANYYMSRALAKDSFTLRKKTKANLIRYRYTITKAL